MLSLSSCSVELDEEESSNEPTSCLASVSSVSFSFSRSLSLPLSFLQAFSSFLICCRGFLFPFIRTVLIGGSFLSTSSVLGDMTSVLSGVSGGWMVWPVLGSLVTGGGGFFTSATTVTTYTEI